MNDTETMRLIREAVKDWRAGKLSNAALCFIVEEFSRPPIPPSAADIAWAKDQIEHRTT